ncbi:hypothetical protein ON010_g13084 [Phytophthora cinnamomi]|nr:hypothetical protein ON010_g13084 [Phytophthora cinnamomi]
MSTPDPPTEIDAQPCSVGVVRKVHLVVYADAEAEEHERAEKFGQALPHVHALGHERDVLSVARRDADLTAVGFVQH